MSNGIQGRGRGCVHLLAFQPHEGGFRYRCVRCFKRLKVVNGVVMSQERERAWFNSHGQRWGWEDADREVRV